MTTQEEKKSTQAIRVALQTSKGKIVLQLDSKAAPITVKNFLSYVESGFYEKTLFHRVIPNFMIQGGGFDESFVQKTTQAPIVNESNNGLRNVKGSISMARTNAPDSATAQFFINVQDNLQLDGSAQRPGYAVFGEVVEGMDVVDLIRNTPTRCPSWTGQPCQETNLPHGMADVPSEAVVILKAFRL